MINTIATVYRDPVGAVYRGMTRAKELRDNPDFFCNISLLGAEIIRTVDSYTGAEKAPKILKNLDAVGLHYFWSFLKVPYNVLYPVNADVVAKDRLLNDLESDLVTHLNNNVLVGNGRQQDPVVRQFLNDQLKEVLKKSYRTPRDLRIALTIKIRGYANNHLNLYPLLPNRANLANYQVLGLVNYVRASNFLEKLKNASFMVVDLMCIPLFLKAFNLWNLEKTANTLGQFRVFNWMPNQSLENWMRGFVCLGFTAKLIEAVSKLHYDRDLTASQIKKAGLDTISATAQLVYNGLGFLNAVGLKQVSPHILSLASIAAKSLECVSIAAAPAA